jgi:hypothetical protein
MGRRKKSTESGQEVKLRPALSPEAWENRQVYLANKLAEQQLLDGTASSQVITHFLKLGTTKNQLEIEKLRAETAKANAQAEAIKAGKRDAELLEKAMKCFSLYRGKENEDEEEMEEDYGEDY